MRSRLRPPPLLRRVLGATLTVTLASQTVALSAANAAEVADPLPRSYQVGSVAEVPDVEFTEPLLAVSTDGRTAVHLSPRGEDPAVLTATDFQTGAAETVGLDLEGQPVPRVSAVAVSGDGRTVAFLATGANAAELHLPADADPDINSAVFVRDRLTKATTWVPVPDLGVPTSRHALAGLALSEDGKRLATEISLPLPKYDGITAPEGVLVATLAADTAPAVRIVGPEDLVADGGDPVPAEPEVRGFALSGDGTVLAVNAYRDSTPVMLRFDAANGDRLPGDRELTSAQQGAWQPNLDRTGRRTAFGGDGAGVVVADLAAGPQADVALAPANPVPYVSGDVEFGAGDPPTDARLSADGSTVAFVRAGALWAQPAQAGQAARLASPGLDGRIADPLSAEGRYPDAVSAPALSGDGSVLGFLSASTAFVSPRTDAPQPSHLYRSVPADQPAPAWPAEAKLTTEPGTTTVRVTWPAASGAVTGYEVTVDGTVATTVDAPGTTATLSKLTPGATVQIGVVAKDAAGRTSGPLTADVTLLEELPPGDAPLSAVAGPGARVRLEWEPATVTGVTGYRVLRDGVKLADVAADVTTYEDRAVAADISYRYAVALLRGTEEIPLTREATVRTPAISVGEAAWNLPRVAGTAYLAPGRTATFALVGAPGFTAYADLSMRTADDPAKQVRVELTEQQAGTYTGSWPVPTGVLELSAAVLRLGDGAGNSLDRPVTGLPAQAGGLLRVDVKAAAGEPVGLRLQVWSDATGSGTVRMLAKNEVIEVPVAPATDHRLTTTRTDGLAGSTPQTLAVGSGQAVDVPLAPTLAASATVTLVGPDDKPVPTMRVSVAGPAGPQAAQTDADGGALFTGLDAGAEVTVSAELSELYLSARGLTRSPSTKLTLRPGDNPVRLKAAALGKVRLSGTTLTADGRPVLADVVVSQQVHGSGVTFRATSGGDGTWGVDVYAGLGTATRVTAKTFSGGLATRELTVGDSAPEPVALVLAPTQGYRITPTVKVKMLDAEVNEQPLDLANAAQYRASLTWPGGRASLGEQVVVNVGPGTDLQLCLDGVDAGLPAACGTAKTGDDPNVPMSVALVEQARFTARIVDAAGAPVDGELWVRVNSLDGKAAARTVRLDGPDVSVSVPSAGSYLLTFGSGTARLQRTVQATEGQLISLGELRLSTTSILDGTKSSIVAVTDSVLPGGTAQIRADITYRDASAAGTARLTLPSGVTVPDGGVLLGGKVTPFTVEENVLVVQLPAATFRTLRIYARAPEQAGVPLPFSLTVTAGEATENLGTATVLSGYVSLTTSGGTTRTGSLPVSGRAPAGVEVVLQDGGVELTRATAGPGGLWTAVVDLGAAGDDVRHHLLRAQAQVGEVLLRSAEVDVVVDPHAAVLLSVSMFQEGGRPVTFSPSDGVARFPYTFLPGLPLVVVARFSGPVRNVQTEVGTTIVGMQAVAGEENTWRVSFRPGIEGLGDLSVLFAPAVERPTLPVPPVPTESLVDPSDVTLQDPQTDGDTVSQTFTAPVPKLGPEARVTGRLTVTKLADYQPSAAERARARESGVHVYAPTIDATNQAEFLRTGNLNLTASAVVDLSTMRQEQPTELTRSLARLGFFDGTVRASFFWAYQAVTTADQTWSAGSEWFIDGKYAAVANLQTMAISCRDEARGRYYQDRVELLQQKAWSMDVAGASWNMAALLLGPETFGLGTIALWAIGWGSGKAMEYEFGNNVDALKAEMLADPECRKDPKDSDSPGLDPRDLQDPVAEPTWIYDPSGFVYEGLQNRRVEGVTATLLHAESPNGPWSVWDAEWYGQSNPLTTDQAGRYGWDVPEGWWKVAYTKDGYLPAESRPLKVLPPHTDVNVNLVRSDLAEVAKVEADKDGLTVTFTQPMRADQVLTGLKVTTPEGEPLGGQWVAMSYPAPVGHPREDSPLATEFRFIGERHSGTAAVLVDEFVQDHVGRAVAQGAERVLTVDWRGPDQVPPQVTVTGVANGGIYRLGAVPATGCTTVDEGSGVATEATLTVAGGTAAGVGVFTATCAGGKDKAGNLAAPVSVTYTTAYVFAGFAAPVQNDGQVTTVQAGKSVPIKWRLTDGTGAPVTNLPGAALSVVAGCGTTPDPVGESAPGVSALENLGDGYYQIKWKTPKSYADTCKTLRVDLGEGPAVAHTAPFRFAA